MTNVQSAIEQVRQAKARYCRFIDTHRFDQWADLLITNPHVRMLDTEGNVIAAFDSRDEFLVATRAFLDGARSSHHIHNEEIDVISDNEIHAIWAMEDLVVIAEPGNDRPARMHGRGHYHETWILTPNGWRIARLELRRTFLDISKS